MVAAVHRSDSASFCQRRPEHQPGGVVESPLSVAVHANTPANGGPASNVGSPSRRVRDSIPGNDSVPYVDLGMTLASWHLDTTPHMENKIVLIQPDGARAWEFFKARPVPGREAAISISGDGKMRILDTPYGRISAAICFDADFPRLLAQAGRSKVDILLVPSNDWKAIDPWHTRMASFRAIEQGFNLVRHASHGFSAAFDYEGHELASMDHFVTEDRSLLAYVPIRGTRTLYSICGDWFGWLCVGSLGIISCLKLRDAQP